MITQFNGIRTSLRVCMCSTFTLALVVFGTFASNAQEGRELDASALRTSAEQGDADAQYKLGVCYEYGEGVGKDMTEAEEWYHKAVKWYRAAAAQGDAEAQAVLVDLYHKKGE